MTDDRPYVLALIPARGGSKSVPRKNVMEVLGRPLIAWSIEQAKRSRHITRAIVSTDDEEIAGVAAAEGADTPFRRPAEISGDRSTDLEAFRHCLEWLRDHEGRLPDLVVHLRPTGPARRLELIDAAIEMMLADPSADALRSMNLSKQTPYKMWLFGENRVVEPVARIPGRPEAHSEARQSLPKAYWQNGYVDVVRPRAVLEMNSMVGRRTLGFVIPHEVTDIDYRDDVAEVEAAIRRIQQGLPEPGEEDEGRVPV